MVKMKNVVDVRNGQYYKVAFVKPQNVRFFVPEEEWEDE